MERERVHCIKINCSHKNNNRTDNDVMGLAKHLPFHVQKKCHQHSALMSPFCCVCPHRHALVPVCKFLWISQCENDCVFILSLTNVSQRGMSFRLFAFSLVWCATLASISFHLLTNQRHPFIAIFRFPNHNSIWRCAYLRQSQINSRKQIWNYNGSSVDCCRAEKKHSTQKMEIHTHAHAHAEKAAAKKNENKFSSTMLPHSHTHTNTYLRRTIMLSAMASTRASWEWKCE